MANANLSKAKKKKADEFYTQSVDIENEMKLEAIFFPYS